MIIKKDPFKLVDIEVTVWVSEFTFEATCKNFLYVF